MYYEKNFTTKNRWISTHFFEKQITGAEKEFPVPRKPYHQKFHEALIYAYSLLYRRLKLFEFKRL